MATAPPPKVRPPAPWGPFQIPKPLQQLFSHFPLRTLEPNDLPARSQYLTTSDLPTLYIFATEDDALLGLPSFNPTCLKYQTLLRCAGIQFRTLPSTNHASPTGSLPFLLPPRSGCSAAAVQPIPSSSLLAYTAKHSEKKKEQQQPSLREEAYLSLLTPLRNAFLYTLYLDEHYTPLLNNWYIFPSTSSVLVQKTLRFQLRQAAAASILSSQGQHPSAGREQIDREAIFAAAGEALRALEELLGESQTGYFFGRETPGEFDAGVFAYLFPMIRHFSDYPLGEMVRNAGKGGELVRFCERVKREAGWRNVV
ncbi:hypothetical protein QBC35DRAFT_25336 [Podospora australis]|uniref:Metaxin-1 n=1 Tax=Podospora australis TaxID=1536484 RepID=A0AAN6WZK7_9PEZI|nr:hypothetical protein QBC35DRAFT_25336 [Podospora australis]